jgi:hypothetical protein
VEAAGRALGETAELVKTQAELFEGTIGALRDPAERAKAADERPPAVSEFAAAGPLFCGDTRLLVRESEW